MAGTWIQGALTVIAKATKDGKPSIREPGSESRFSAFRGEGCPAQTLNHCPRESPPPATLHAGDQRQAHCKAVCSFLDHKSCVS